MGSLAGTSITLSNIILLFLCTIWYEKVNGGDFHSKGKYHKPQFYLELEVKYPVGRLFHS